MGRCVLLLPIGDTLSDLTPLVLVHGLLGGSAMWEPQVAALGSSIRLIVPDLPGFGATPGPFTLDGAAQTVVDAAMPSQPVDVCGLSLGAIVAARVAAEHPGLVRNLVLSGVQVRPPRSLLAVQQTVMRVVPSRALGGRASKATALRVLGALRSLDLTDDLARITARTLVVCGSRDKANLKGARQAAHGIQGAELRIIPGVGHLWNKQRPDAFDAMLLGFRQGPVASGGG
jgi:pimeloyl-ACP methyl ester carboxylesterase